MLVKFQKIIVVLVLVLFTCGVGNNVHAAGLSDVKSKAVAAKIKAENLKSKIVNGKASAAVFLKKIAAKAQKNKAETDKLNKEKERGP